MIAAHKRHEFCIGMRGRLHKRFRYPRTVGIYFLEDRTTVSTTGFTPESDGIGSGTIDDIFRGCNAIPS